MIDIANFQKLIEHNDKIKSVLGPGFSICYTRWSQIPILPQEIYSTFPVTHSVYRKLVKFQMNFIDG